MDRLRKAHFLNFAATSNLMAGIVDDAGHAGFSNFNTDLNFGNGVVVNSAAAVRLSHFVTSSTTGNGVALFGATGAVLSDFTANNSSGDLNTASIVLLTEMGESLAQGFVGDPYQSLFDFCLLL
jgi:hypothetical protein